MSIDIPLAERATLVTSKDHQLKPAFGEIGGECALSLSVATVPAGSTRTGCIPFQVPVEERAKVFELAGFGRNPAEWDLTSVRPLPGTPEAGPPQSARGAVD